MGVPTPPKRHHTPPRPQPRTLGGGRRPNYRVLLYIPNIIGYARLSLLLLAFSLLPSSPVGFVSLYVASIILDGFDGYAARKLRQCSLFGAWMLYMVSALEWTSFCCNYALGPEWQRAYAGGRKEVPPIIAYLMANNWRNPLGVWVISGLHVFPVWLFGMQHGIFASHLSFLPFSVQVAGLVVLGSGRVVCGVAEVWCLCSHIAGILVNTSAASLLWIHK
ncbi:CDP-diacylglycerol--inositol 3-phosphatidyltransferase [Chionoecetes opilio]|uniref:CDP-diacylglycerol--inositol 3-phosphatidyltransferase n=1 Tax=Chionoecetes opilio TaxID=41210 RepID=A0A8J4YSS5_CHIOP|nr:CDP-diacylglycerol--inositol 3-phosphatidyltransferase [Chionoecetes opilio]